MSGQSSYKSVNHPFMEKILIQLNNVFKGCWSMLIRETFTSSFRTSFRYTDTLNEKEKRTRSYVWMINLEFSQKSP